MNRNIVNCTKNSLMKCYSIFNFMCMFCISLFVLFLLVIVLSVLRRFIDSGYPFGIFKLFLLSTMTQLISKYLGSPTGFCVGMLLKLRWFSPNPISCTIGGTNKTYPNDIAEILLKLVLSTIKQTNKHIIPNLPLVFSNFPQLRAMNV